jgi:hypothetical protein
MDSAQVGVQQHRTHEADVRERRHSTAGGARLGGLCLGKRQSPSSSASYRREVLETGEVGLP